MKHFCWHAAQIRNLHFKYLLECSSHYIYSVLISLRVATSNYFPHQEICQVQLQICHVI